MTDIPPMFEIDVTFHLEIENGKWLCDPETNAPIEFQTRIGTEDKKENLKYWLQFWYEHKSIKTYRNLRPVYARHRIVDEVTK